MWDLFRYTGQEEPNQFPSTPPLRRARCENEALGKFDLNDGSEKNVA